MLNYIKLLITILGVKSGVATTFSASGDRWNPNPSLACLHRNLDDRRDLVIAHRTLPCGTKLLLYLYRTNRSVVATVGDRGPWGRRRNGLFRAEMDLAPAAKRALYHNGYEPILFWVLK